MKNKRKAVIRFCPGERGPLVTLHACWSADNGYETAVFPTEAEAVSFAWRRWRMESVVDRRGAGGGDR